MGVIVTSLLSVRPGDKLIFGARGAVPTRPRTARVAAWAWHPRQLLRAAARRLAGCVRAAQAKVSAGGARRRFSGAYGPSPLACCSSGSVTGTDRHSCARAADCGCACRVGTALPGRISCIGYPAVHPSAVRLPWSTLASPARASTRCGGLACRRACPGRAIATCVTAGKLLPLDMAARSLQLRRGGVGGVSS